MVSKEAKVHPPNTIIYPGLFSLNPTFFTPTKMMSRGSWDNIQICIKDVCGGVEMSLLFQSGLCCSRLCWEMILFETGAGICDREKLVLWYSDVVEIWRIHRDQIWFVAGECWMGWATTEQETRERETEHVAWSGCGGQGRVHKMERGLSCSTRPQPSNRQKWLVPPNPKRWSQCRLPPPPQPNGRWVSSKSYQDRVRKSLCI